MFTETTATGKIKKLDKRIQLIPGGTSAGKTISALMKLIALAQTDETPTLTSVVSESMPHLQRGAIRDFLNIMTSQKYFKPDRWRKNPFSYTFETGSTIEFFSADSPDKVRGPRRDRLFINEGNNIKWDAADQLIIRTRELIIVDWNPTAEFWAYTQIMDVRPENDWCTVTVTYQDNEALEQEIIDEIESHKHNKNWWRVYGEGKLGEVEGRIYTGWKIIDSLPHEARLEARGVDFGYKNDPATIVDVYYYNGGYILDEQLYRKGYLNRQLAAYIEALPQPNTLIIADSAEPKSIDELRIDYNLPIIGADKGKHDTKSSIKWGIDKVQSQRISMTKRSVNLIKEYRNYLYQTDETAVRPDNPTGIINEPEPGFDHLMDPVRYVITHLNPDQTEEDDDKIKTGSLDELIY